MPNALFLLARTRRSQKSFARAGLGNKAHTFILMEFLLHHELQLKKTVYIINYKTIQETERTMLNRRDIADSQP